MPCKRVLVILKGFLGDAVMTTPLLEGLANQPNTQVEVLTSRPVITLLEDTFPNITFIEQKRIESPKELIRQIRELSPGKHGIALVVNRSFRSALVAFLARIPLRVGHSTDFRSVLLTKSAEYKSSRYEVSSYLDLAKLAGIDLPDGHPRLTPRVDLLESTRSKLGNASIGIQPGASNTNKSLPSEILAKVVTALQKEADVVLLGGPEEKTYGEELERRLDHKPLNLIGELSLKESTAAVSQLKVLVGADTGLMHIAAATGCPTVTLFGPTPSKKWGHFYEPHQVLTAPERVMSNFDAESIVEAVRRILCR